MTETKKRAATRMVPAPSHGIIPERDFHERPVLEARNLGIDFGGLHAVEDFNLIIGKTEIAGLIGPNGAGKSTTMNTVAGLLKPKSGSITFEGHDVTTTPANKVVSLGLALCPEGRRVFQQMSVRENLEMGGYTRPAGEIAASLDQVFEQFPRLKERQRQISGTLSGGEQQMLAMGRALMSKPKLLMLDEPSMGLAPILVEQIFEIILKLNQTGTTILLVEQNAQMALSIANRAYVLETGHIVKEGSADTLMHDDAVRKAYLG